MIAQVMTYALGLPNTVPSPKSAPNWLYGNQTKRNGNDRAGYAHFYYVRPVFAFLAAGVVYDICPNSGKRNVYDNGNEVHDVHIDRLNASVFPISTFVADRIMFVAITARNFTPMPPPA